MTVRDWINVGILSLVAIFLGVTFADIRGAVIAVWTLSVLGYGLINLADRLGVLVLRSPFDNALVRVRQSPRRPVDLQRCEHSFGWKSYSLRDFDHEVRPQLGALVAHRARGRDQLDDDLAELVHPTVQDESEVSIVTNDLVKLVQKIEEL
jgi:hypothetical protein